MPSLIGGFFVYGLFYGWLDQKAAKALRRHDYGGSFIWFLPAMGMLAPLASLAEIMGNVAAAFMAAYGWQWLWRKWESRQASKIALTAASKDVSGRNSPWQGRVSGLTEVADQGIPPVSSPHKDNGQ
jgi:hypothetical protein